MTTGRLRDLVRRYPQLCVRETVCGSVPMGFECRDGWYDLLDRLSARILESCRAEKVVPPEVVQVKEKFGTLRYYMQGRVPAAVAQAVDEAEAESAAICEFCGAPGELTESQDGAYYTLCAVQAQPFWLLKCYRPRVAGPT